MCPNSFYFGLKVLPTKGPLGSKYILFGYMDPWGLLRPLQKTLLVTKVSTTLKLLTWAFK